MMNNQSATALSQILTNTMSTMDAFAPKSKAIDIPEAFLQHPTDDTMITDIDTIRFDGADKAKPVMTKAPYSVMPEQQHYSKATPEAHK